MKLLIPIMNQLYKELDDLVCHAPINGDVHILTEQSKRKMMFSLLWDMDDRIRVKL